MLGDLVDRQRLRRGEQGRFDGARQLVHHAALSLIGRERLILGDVEPAAPRQLERREEARGERRAAELRVLGRGQEALEEGPVERHPDHPATRSIASSSVITERAWTTCIAG